MATLTMVKDPDPDRDEDRRKHPRVADGVTGILTEYGQNHPGVHRILRDELCKRAPGQLDKDVFQRPLLRVDRKRPSIRLPLPQAAGAVNKPDRIEQFLGPATENVMPLTA